VDLPHQLAELEKVVTRLGQSQFSVTASKLSSVDSQALTKTWQQKSLTKSCHNSGKVVILELQPLVRESLTANTVSLDTLPYI
jgi:hypothetical protein